MVSFETQRKSMVEGQVRPSDVTDARLIQAMGEIPRERFVPNSLASLAYMDEMLMLGGGRGLMAPRAFAKLVHLAAIAPADSVLDVGCCTGYSTAVLSKLAATVVAVECDAHLRAAAIRNLGGLGLPTVVVDGSLVDGVPNQAPFAVIFLGGSVADVPASLLDQLEDGGRLVSILSGKTPSRAAVWRRSGPLFGCTPSFEAAAPPLPGFTRTTEFVF